MKKLLIIALMFGSTLCAEEAWKPLPTKPVKPPKGYAEGTQNNHCSTKNKDKKDDKKVQKEFKEIEKMRERHLKHLRKKNVRDLKKKHKAKT